jgi:hypothetical protein
VVATPAPKVKNCGQCKFPKVTACICVCDKCKKWKRSSLPAHEKCGGCNKKPKSPVKTGHRSLDGAVGGVAMGPVKEVE